MNIAIITDDGNHREPDSHNYERNFDYHVNLRNSGGVDMDLLLKLTSKCVQTRAFA